MGYFGTRDEFVIDPDQRDGARHNLDNALFRLEGSFARMRSALSRERNCATLAASLPPEILVEIFSYGGIRTTFLATRVCHRWRVSALNQASLWSQVNMASRKYSENLLRVQLERSGQYPLDLTFRLVEVLERVENKMLPEKPISIIRKASSISNLCTRTVSSEWSDALPLLESLHLCVHSSRAAEQFLLKPYNLRHYSIDFRGYQFPLPSQTVRNLWTLHLKRSNEPAIEILEAVVNMSCLRELYLDTCENGEDLSLELVDATIQNSKIGGLNVVYLKQVSTPFLTCFLRRGIVTSTTNVRLEPRPPASWQLPRDNPVNSVWIDFTLKCALYRHDGGNALTHVALGEPNEPNEALPICTMPDFASFEALNSLFWTGMNLRSPPFQLIPSLVTLAFKFHPARIGEPKESLIDVVDSYLASSCPRLRYLGVSIRRPKISSAILQRDDAEDAISTFLEAWVDFHGEVFPTVELYDESRSRRWSQRLDVLKACTGSFEVKERCVLEDLNAPRFPSLRRFVVEDKGEEPLPFRGFAQTFW
jgi:F-box-like